MPKSVDIYIEGKDVNRELVNNPDKTKFNENVCNNWSEIYKRLSKTRDQWKKYYDYETIKLTIDGLISAIILFCVDLLFFIKCVTK